VPLDVAAAALIECRNVPQGVLHLVHPRPVPLELIARMLATELNLPLCPYTEWLGDLETQVHDVDMGDRDLPALRLLDFFRSMSRRWEEASEPVLLCTNAVESSVSLRNVAPLNAVDVQRWIGHWRSIGFM
jgi:hypothetical protein